MEDIKKETDIVALTSKTNCLQALLTKSSYNTGSNQQAFNAFETSPCVFYAHNNWLGKWEVYETVFTLAVHQQYSLMVATNTLSIIKQAIICQFSCPFLDVPTTQLS